jgi:sulfite reductase alpha subunit-like flavoprotein
VRFTYNIDFAKNWPCMPMLCAHAGHYSEERPFWAKLKHVELLTSEACRDEKRVLHAAFDVSGSGMKFLAGDAFTVHPSNDLSLVKALLEHLQEDGSQCASLLGGNHGCRNRRSTPH